MSPVDNHAIIKSVSQSTENLQHFDLVIVGGGMSGACMALALAPLSISIAIIDAVSHDEQTQPSFDDRSIALSYGSARILQSIGVWGALESSTSAIEHIHVSDKGHFGFARLHAEEMNLPALGYVVENRAAGDVFYRELEQRKNITLLAPYQVTDFSVAKEKGYLAIAKSNSENEEGNSRLKLSADLVIAADGTLSKMAQLTGTSHQRESYQQMAIILNAATDRPKSGWAYERFTDSGPLALLPLSGNRYSVVWSIKATDKESFLAMRDSEFRTALQQRFGFRAGRITQVGKRQIYPLINQKLATGFSQRLAFIGNALHTSHPVAGQGFNLGLRDIAVLAEKVAIALTRQEDIGSQMLLEDYWQCRGLDIQQTQQRIDGLARLFISQNPLLSMSRNLALKWLDVIPVVKKAFTDQAMGLRNDLPLLARGLSLDEIISSTKANN